MKKLMIFLMLAVPLVVILMVNLTIVVVSGLVPVTVEKITISQTEVRSKINQNISLDVTFYPENATNKELEWVSDNEDVATVDSNGNISFVGLGSGYITATSMDGNKKASCYFYVYDDKVHEVYAEMKINPNNYVEEGGFFDISFGVSPNEAVNKEVVFSTDDAEIATVDANGRVSGHKIGKTKITTTSVSNPSIYKELIVEVVKPLNEIIVASGITFVSAATFQINYEISPLNAGFSTIEFVSKDSSIATVDNMGVVTFLQKGQVEIEIKSEFFNINKTITLENTNGFASNLILDKTTIDVEVGDEEVFVGYVTEPQNIDVEVVFSSENESVAYVDSSGYVQFFNGGSTIIKARVLKNENEYIERIVVVNVRSLATEILIEDEIFTVDNSVQLLPKSLPATSTNENFYYSSSDESVATVSDKGLVTFKNNSSQEVMIEIIANSPSSSVKKVVKVIYTNGLPLDMFLKDNLTLEFGDVVQITPTFLPQNFSNAELTYNILSQNENNGGINDVVELDENGFLRAVGGGVAEIEVSCQSYFGKIVKVCQVIVKRDVERVELVLKDKNNKLIDFENGEFLTALPRVNVEIKTFPEDANSDKVEWKILDSDAVMDSESSFRFNTPSTIQIQIKNNEQDIAKYEVVYTANSLFSAEIELKEEIQSGEKAFVNIVKFSPSNAEISTFITQNSSSTIIPMGKVVEIVENNAIIGVCGGFVSLTVHINNFEFVKNVEVFKNADSIIVNQAGLQTTKNKIQLTGSVSPQDATIKNISYLIINDDMAEFNQTNQTLTFKKDGICEIKAFVQNKDLSITEHVFTVEKIEKGTGDITSTEDPIYMQVGEENKINVSVEGFEYVSKDLIMSQEDLDKGVVEISGDVVKALSLGDVEINCVFTNQHGKEKTIKMFVYVVKLSESVEFDSDLDKIENSYYTALAEVELSATVSPENTSNRNVSFTVSNFVSNVLEGIAPTIEDKTLKFFTEGTAYVLIETEDGASSQIVVIVYTNGNAVDAELNFKDEVNLNVGQEITINVEKWIPENVLNKAVFIKEVNNSSASSKIIEINGLKITALKGGQTWVQVELSNGLVKELKIIIQTLVTSIVIDNIITSDDEIVINPIVLPSLATNKNVEITIKEGSVATISNNIIKFTEAGLISVLIKALDGGGVEKTITVESTFNKIKSFELTVTEKTILKNQFFVLAIKSVFPSNIANTEFVFEKIINPDNVQIDQSGRITGLKSGTSVVRVSTQNGNGETIFKDCVVNVIVPVERFDIEFLKNISADGSVITVAEDTLGFQPVVYPQDAELGNVLFEISNSNAVIENNEITFINAGVVEIKFIMNDEFTKTYRFIYTGGELTFAEVDQSNKEINMDAGEYLEFTLKSFAPVDVENFVFEIKNQTQDRVDISKEVIKFENNRIYALNGGSASFDLYVNGYNLGRYKVSVYKAPKEIFVEKEEFFTNVENFEFSATVLPSDTVKKDISFEIIKGAENAELTFTDGTCSISFKKQGVISVKIVLDFDKSIYKIIKVHFTNVVGNLVFNDTTTQLFTGYPLELVVTGEPFNVLPYKIGFLTSNTEIIEILPQTDEQKANNRITIRALKEGEAFIKAYVVNDENNTQPIFVEKKITVVSLLSDVKIELNDTKDSQGIGDYKVWGTKFIQEGTLEKGNTFKIPVKTIPENTKMNLVWTSSNPHVLTVSDNGVVTFLAPGQATLRVEPQLQVSSANPLYNEFHFTVVEGVNIFNAEEFLKISSSEVYACVLQNDIMIPSKVKSAVVVGKGLHGNGYQINFGDSQVKRYQYCMVVNRDNVFIDNVTIRGANFQESNALTELSEAADVLFVGRNDKPIKGVLLKNIIVENGRNVVYTRNSQVEIIGCILRNAFLSTLYIKRGPVEEKSDIYIKDCVFGNAMVTNIVGSFDIKNPEHSKHMHKVVIEGVCKFYNWTKQDEICSDALLGELGNVTGNMGIDFNEILGELFDANPSFVYTDSSGEKYIMLAMIVGQIETNFLDTVGTTMDLHYRSTNPCETIDINTTVHALAGTVSAILKGEIYSYSNNDPVIKPGDTYDTKIYDEIRQNFKFI